MEPISNVDRLVLILRQRLQEKAAGTRAAARAPASARAEVGGMKRVLALAAVDEITDDQLKRAFLQRVIGDFFGDNMLNESRFQQVIDQVAKAIEEDPDLSKLIAKVVIDLRSVAS